jgi:hypothetical protein
MVCVCLAVASVAQAVWVENQAAASMTRTNAVMVGNILDTNGVTGALQLHLLYAKSDYSTNFAAWTYTNTFAVASTGAVSTNVVGLLPATRYYYNWVIASTNARFWPTGSSNVVTLSGAPTGAAPVVVYHPVMEGTNGGLAASTNFFGMNTGRLSQAQVVLVPDLAAYATTNDFVRTNGGEVAYLTLPNPSLGEEEETPYSFGSIIDLPLPGSLRWNYAGNHFGIFGNYDDTAFPSWGKYLYLIGPGAASYYCPYIHMGTDSMELGHSWYGGFLPLLIVSNGAVRITKLTNSVIDASCTIAVTNDFVRTNGATSGGGYYAVTNNAGAVQLVAFTPGGGGGIADAPSDNVLYGRSNATWTAISAGGGASTNDLASVVYVTNAVAQLSNSVPGMISVSNAATLATATNLADIAAAARDVVVTNALRFMNRYGGYTKTMADFSTNNLTTDASFRSLDLSTLTNWDGTFIVPVGTRYVSVFLATKNSVVGSAFAIYSLSSNTNPCVVVWNCVANQLISSSGVVPLYGTNRYVWYYGDGSFTDIRLLITGSGK